MTIQQLARAYCDAAVQLELAERKGDPAIELAQEVSAKRQAYLDAKQIAKKEVNNEPA